MPLNRLRFPAEQSDSDCTRTMQLTKVNTIMNTRCHSAINKKALNAFIDAKLEIDAMLARLQAHSNEHFDALPKDIHWGHVGSLNHYISLLKRITDSAFNEGENAE